MCVCVCVCERALVGVRTERERETTSYYVPRPPPPQTQEPLAVPRGLGGVCCALGDTRDEGKSSLKVNQEEVETEREIIQRYPALDWAV